MEDALAITEQVSSKNGPIEPGRRCCCRVVSSLIVHLKHVRILPIVACVKSTALPSQFMVVYASAHARVV